MLLSPAYVRGILSGGLDVAPGRGGHVQSRATSRSKNWLERRLCGPFLGPSNLVERGWDSGITARERSCHPTLGPHHRMRLP